MELAVRISLNIPSTLLGSRYFHGGRAKRDRWRKTSCTTSPSSRCIIYIERERERNILLYEFFMRHVRPRILNVPNYFFLLPRFPYPYFSFIYKLFSPIFRAKWKSRKITILSEIYRTQRWKGDEIVISGEFARGSGVFLASRYNGRLDTTKAILLRRFDFDRLDSNIYSPRNLNSIGFLISPFLILIYRWKCIL